MQKPFVAAGSTLILAVALASLPGCAERAPEVRGAPIALDPIQGSEVVKSAKAPNVPPPLRRTHATKVIVELEVREQPRELAEGVDYLYWTFGDDAPGPFLRVREGDLVEVHLHNHPDNTLAHDVSFQAATGPGGGSAASFVAPGHSSVFTFRALKPGLYLYTSNAAPAALHVANGMYGQILVEPRAGLPPVDREYQVVQSEFYTEGKFGERGPQRFSMEKALREQPEYVVFNGSVGALTGEHALRARVGESVRVYFGNAGPNLVSSFHVGGESFDSVYAEGGTLPNQHHVQTTMVPAGGSAIVELSLDVPGEYALVDHSLFRSSKKGTIGALVVEGKDNRLVFSGTTSYARYNPGTELAKSSAFLDEASGDPGATVFATVCATCHQPTGSGLAKVFPPLAGSDFLVADPERAIRIVMNGLKGPIRVNGEVYDSEMPNPRLTDEQIAAVVSYVLTNFGNRGSAVSVADVARVRAARNGPEGPLVADPRWASSAQHTSRGTPTAKSKSKSKSGR